MPTTPRWPNETYVAKASVIGGACGVLLVSEPKWVHRRVETIDVLSTELTRRTVSVDFTIPVGLRQFLELNEGTYAIPIASLEKKPLRNFDLRDESGRAVPVVGRDHNGEISHQALVSAANRALRAANEGSISSRTDTDLRAIARGSRPAAHDALNSMIRGAENGDGELQTLLADRFLSFLLARLTDSYCLIALVDQITTRRILKFAYDEQLNDARGLLDRVAEGLGVRPLMMDIEVPAAARCLSYHAEIVIPEELRLEAAILYDEESGTLHGADFESDRGAVYADPKVDALEQPRLVVWVRPQRPGFPSVALAISCLTAALLWLGVFVWTPDPAAAGPAVSILLSASALFAGTVAQRGEHPLVKAFFLAPRLVLGLVGICAVGSAAALALGAPECDVELIWTIGASATTVLAATLGFSWWRAKPLVRRSGQD